MTLLISNEEAPLREQRDPDLLRGNNPLGAAFLLAPHV